MNRLKLHHCLYAGLASTSCGFSTCRSSLVYIIIIHLCVRMMTDFMHLISIMSLHSLTGEGSGDPNIRAW